LAGIIYYSTKVNNSNNKGKNKRRRRKEKIVGFS
jgi:hypothetical protein